MTHSVDVLMILDTNLQVTSVGESIAAAAEHRVRNERLGESSACTRRTTASTMVSCSSRRCPRADLDINQSVETAAEHQTHHATFPLRGSDSTAATMTTFVPGDSRDSATALQDGGTASEMLVKSTRTEPGIKSGTTDSCQLLSAGALESRMDTHASTGDATAPPGSPRSIDVDGSQAMLCAIKPVELRTGDLPSSLGDPEVDAFENSAPANHDRLMPVCLGATDQGAGSIGSTDAATDAESARSSTAVEALPGFVGPSSGIEDFRNSQFKAIVAPAGSGAACPQEADTRQSVDCCLGNAASRARPVSDSTHTSAEHSRCCQNVGKAHDRVLSAAGEVSVDFDEPIPAGTGRAQPLFKGKTESCAYVNTNSPLVHTNCVPVKKFAVSGGGHAGWSSSSIRPNTDANAYEQRLHTTKVEGPDCVKAVKTASSTVEQSCSPRTYESPRIQAVAQTEAGFRSKSHSPVREMGALQMPVSPRGAFQLLP